MGKDKEKNWNEYPLTDNAVQLRRYMDVCHADIVASDSQCMNRERIACNPREGARLKTRQTGFLGQQLSYIKHAPCYICKREFCTDGNGYMANPFARAQYTIICEECKTKAYQASF